MSTSPNDPPRRPSSSAALAWSLAVSGVGATAIGSALTFGPWAVIALGAIPADTAILFGFAGPALGIVVLVGCGGSTAATLVAARAGSGRASACGFGGFVLAVGYGVALGPTGMHSVVIGSAAADVAAGASRMMC